MEETKKWTVMVYLAGDNNLDTNGVLDLSEMKKIGSTRDIHIIAQFDRAGANRPTTRYRLKKETLLEEDVLESIHETNTGSPETLFDFISWGIEKFPAAHYMVILWNHGQGWDDTDIFAAERVRGQRLFRPGRIRHAFFETSVRKAALLSSQNRDWSRAILIDDDARDFLDCLEMKQVVMKVKDLQGRKIDILGMDACLMSMVEVGCQIQYGVHYMVGSEETEPLDGWPYDTILGYLSENPGTTPYELSKIIVQQYIASYADKGEAVTQSSCNLDAFKGLVDAMTRLSEVLIECVSDHATYTLISRARNMSQSYQVKDNIDLIHFCRLLSNMAVPESLAKACQTVISAIVEKNGAVIESGFCDPFMDQSHGLAIYFPIRRISALYERLDFAIETGWGKFLKKYVYRS